MIQFKKSAICGNCNDCNLRSPLFSLLTSNELLAINEGRFEVSYKAGEMIFKQGSASSHIMMLTSGLAKIYIEGNNSRNLILKIIKPIEMFGGPGVFLDQRNYYSATALEDTTVCFIAHDNFRKALRSNADFAEQFIIHINKNAIFTFGKFADITQKQMPGRVADALLYLCKEIYASKKFKISLSRQDLADMTSLSKESFIRILKEFKEDDIIRLNGDDIEILNLERLERISAVG